MTVALVLISLSFFGDKDKGTGFAVFGLALYMSFFSLGMGPGAWLIPSEVFATSIRAKAMSVATFFNRITATLMASTFLSTSAAIGWGGFFLMLAGVCVLVGIFFYFLLPETKGRSLEDMSVYFAELTGDTSILDAEKKIIQQREQSGTVEMTSDKPEKSGDGEMT
jgi:fatty acid desaturase